MARRFIDTVLEGWGSYAGKYYFFGGGQYVRYDVGNDRTDARYPAAATEWNLTGAFATGLDAAFNGVGSKYEGKAYFFRGSEYVRYNWADNTIDSGYPLQLGEWNLPQPFASGVDAALNGVGQYAGKTYFFKGSEYIRYDWDQNAVDIGPTSLTAWGLSGDFALGIEAAMNGQGAYDGKAYFFKGDQYVRYNWADNTVESGYPAALNLWPGAKEMLCAGVAKMKALEWIGRATSALTDYASAVENGTPYGGDSNVMELALGTHFKIDNAMGQTAKVGRMSWILGNYSKLVAALNDSANVFRFRNFADVTSDNALDDKGVPNPAYAVYNASINFTTTYGGFGPLCQTAMCAHEPVHYIDDKADRDHDFYEHIEKYKTMSAEEASHNPSSYACFAEHIYYGKDERYGAGRSNE